MAVDTGPFQNVHACVKEHTQDVPIPDCDCHVGYHVPHAISCRSCQMTVTTLAIRTQDNMTCESGSNHKTHILMVE